MGFFREAKRFFLHWFNDTRVFALVGSSGSGKSYSSDILVKHYDIDLVIDDGLLIKSTKVLAGISAKQENSEIMAVKRAIFFYNRHRSQVIRQIDLQRSPRILVLGTSDKMVSRICENLFLPQPCKTIRIEDISTKDEIEYSHRMRDSKGKHIVPIPYLELRKYIGSFERDDFIDEDYLMAKTLVSPRFGRNASGTYSNSEMEIVLTDMIRTQFANLDVIRVVAQGGESACLTVYIRNRLNANAAYDADAVREHLDRICLRRFKKVRVGKVILERLENP